MIAFEKAYKLVLEHTQNFETEQVPLQQATGRVLAESIVADRDFPPFNRSTKDGIAINLAAQPERTDFKVSGIAAAGSPQLTIVDATTCVEIMTGAILPVGADTIVMYEHISIENGTARIQEPIKLGQNIHGQGSDEPKGALVLAEGVEITAAEIGVLASVGKSTVTVKKLPKIAIISTGNELVDVEEIPLAHQIRKSNVHSLYSKVLEMGIQAAQFHIADDAGVLQTKIEEIVKQYDVLLLSGGVSMGKFDFLPQVFEALNVKKLFHKVKQRPGKPFWFGKHIATETTIFSFPGNPTSSYANYHVYFIPWLKKSLGLEYNENLVILNEPFENKTALTRFVRAKTSFKDGMVKIDLVHGNGSGDLTSLTHADGFVKIAPSRNYNVGEKVPFIPTKSVL